MSQEPHVWLSWAHSPFLFFLVFSKWKACRKALTELMEGEIVVFKADVCLRAFWHCRRKKKYSQSKGFKESQSLLSLFCTLYSSWCFAVAWSTMTTYNFFFLCTSAKHTPHTWQLFRSPLPKSQDRPWVPQLLVYVDGKRHKEQSRFLDHMPYKRSGLLVGKDGKERGKLEPSSQPGWSSSGWAAK